MVTAPHGDSSAAAASTEHGWCDGVMDHGNDSEAAALTEHHRNNIEATALTEHEIHAMNSIRFKHQASGSTHIGLPSRVAETRAQPRSAKTGDGQQQGVTKTSNRAQAEGCKEQDTSWHK